MIILLSNINNVVVPRTLTGGGPGEATMVLGIKPVSYTHLNYWESNGISADGESLDFYLPSPQPVHCVQLIFDTNLCRSIKITLSSKRMGQQLVGVPPELVKDYTISLWNKGVVVHRKEVKNNYMRLNRVADVYKRQEYNHVRCESAKQQHL